MGSKIKQTGVLAFCAVVWMVLLFADGKSYALLSQSSMSESSDFKTVPDQLDFSGHTCFRYSVDTKDNNANKHLRSFKNRTIIKIDHNRFVLSGISDYLYFGPENETEAYSLDIHEMYFRYQNPSLEFTLGKQIKRWGKTDQISPVDTLNPENITDFILSTYEDRKIPVWMADVIYRKNDFFIEGVFIPFFEPSRFHYFGTDWAVFSHLKQEIAHSSLSPVIKSYVDSITVNETMPDSGLNSFEYAIRTGGTISRFDFGFTYHYAIEDLPFFTSFPVKNFSLDTLVSDPLKLVFTNENIETTYLRTHMFGFEFETTVSDFGVRGEVAIKDKESFITGSVTSVRNPTLSWLAGIDYISRNQWYVNLQLGHQHIFDYDPAILYFKNNTWSVFGEVKKDLVSGWLHGNVQFTGILNDQSWYLSPRISCTYIRNIEVILGMTVFGGDKDTVMGRYDSHDQFFIQLTYHF